MPTFAFDQRYFYMLPFIFVYFRSYFNWKFIFLQSLLNVEFFIIECVSKVDAKSLEGDRLCNLQHFEFTYFYLKSHCYLIFIIDLIC